MMKLNMLEKGLWGQMHYNVVLNVSWSWVLVPCELGCSPAASCHTCASVFWRRYALPVEMGDEIFTFESFINFMNFLKYFKTPFWNFHWNFVFNYNLLIIRRNVQSSLTTTKGQWLEERHNDTYYFVTYLL